MMWPGAKGLAAIRISMKTKRANRGMEIERKTIVIVSDQATFPPRSMPTRRANTAVTSENAPRKSIRCSLANQCECSTLGSSRTK